MTMHYHLPKWQAVRALRRGTLKSLWAVCVGLLTAFLLVLNVLLVWVATGPRNLQRVLPYIERSLSGLEGGYTVKIDQGVLVWDGWRHPIDIRLHGVNIFTTDGRRFAAFPDVSLGLDLFDLAIGRIEPASVIVRHPVVSLFAGANGHISFGIPAQVQAESPQVQEEAGEGAVLTALAGAFLADHAGSPLHRLHRVEIIDADVSVGNAERGVFLRARKARFAIHRGWRGVALKVDAEIMQDQAGKRPPAHVTADFSGHSGGALEGKVSAVSLWPLAFEPLLQDVPALSAMRFTLSGTADVTLDAGGAPLSAHYVLHGGKGSIHTDLLEEELPVDHVDVEGSAQGTSLLSVEKFVADFGAYAAQGAFQLRLTPQGPGLSGAAEVHNVPLAHVRRFWPPSLSPQSRQWVVENITQGTATRAGVEVNIPPGGMGSPALPEGAIHGTVEFENAMVRYLPQHPPVKNLSGSLQVGVKVLDAQATRGTALANTQISHGHVHIDDLTLDNPRIEVEVDAQSPAADVVEFMSLPPVQKAARLKLDKKSATGTFVGHARVGFYYFTPKDANGQPQGDMGVDYQVSAQIKDAGQPGFMGKFDIAQAGGVMEVDNQHLHYAGGAVVNGASVQKADITYRFTPLDGIDTIIIATATAPVSSLPRFGYPELAFLSGALGVEAKVEMGDALERAHAKISLKDAGVDWPKLNWKKPPGEAAALELTSEKKDGLTHISQFSFSAHDAMVKGNAAFGAGFALKELSLDPFRLGNDDAVLRYAAIPGGYRIDVRGKSLDVSGLMKGTDDFSFQHFPALQLSADLRALVVGKNELLADMKADVQCGDICTSANIAGEAEGKPFTFRIARTGANARSLSAKAADAGALLRMLDIYDTMHGGGLTLSGKFDDAKPGHPLTGTLAIDKHTIDHAPVLTKLLSLASLTGLLDALGGNGITFDRLRAPFTLENDVITLKDAKTHGDSMGLTADGTIRFPGQVYDLKGTVVPAYSLNHVLGKVPLIGDIITGGGEGVFAARYTIKGPHDKPDVSVNPLSILTPGFLRNVFDIMDSGDDEDQKPAGH